MTQQEAEGLTQQLILVFYGVGALQEYRADHALVPVTVYQAVRAIAKQQQALLSKVLERLPEKLQLIDVGALTGPTGTTAKESMEIWQVTYLQGFNAALNDVAQVIKEMMGEMK